MYAYIYEELAEEFGAEAAQIVARWRDICSSQRAGRFRKSSGGRNVDRKSTRLNSSHRT